jgi:YlmC/YmxH family sporulation protein
VVKALKISDFQTKDVINIIDGKKLGQVSDLELDLRLGRIDAIIVPAQGKFFGLFGGSNDVIIPWKNIVKIGMDVVLVKLDEGRLYRSNEESESTSSPSSYDYGNTKQYRS